MCLPLRQARRRAVRRLSNLRAVPAGNGPDDRRERNEEVNPQGIPPHPPTTQLEKPAPADEQRSARTAPLATRASQSSLPSTPVRLLSPIRASLGSELISSSWSYRGSSSLTFDESTTREPLPHSVSTSPRSRNAPESGIKRRTHPAGGAGCSTPRGGRAYVGCGPPGEGLVAAAAGLEAAEGLLDLRLGLGAADPVGALDGLAGLEVLVDLEEVLDLQPVELADVVDVLQVLHAAGRARARTAPCRRRRPRRVIRNMPIARQVIRQPGNVGSSSSTSASSGSPSSPRVFSMKP